jgi:predicted RNase H-like HicB family nuclease
MKRNAYTVVFEPIEDGWWMASVPAVQGVRTQGRSLNEARTRVREALALAIGDRAAATAGLRDDVRLPDAAKKLVRRVREVRQRLERDERKASASTAKAARLLTKQLGYSTRDAGELLGLSHQRIQQLVSP